MAKSPPRSSKFKEERPSLVDPVAAVERARHEVSVRAMCSSLVIHHYRAVGHRLAEQIEEFSVEVGRPTCDAVSMEREKRVPCCLIEVSPSAINGQHRPRIATPRRTIFLCREDMCRNPKLAFRRVASE